LETVRSRDGTGIAVERRGEGPPVVLISGASTTRAIHAPLSELLAEDFMVFNYDRRGRGESSDTAPYAVEREIEDLKAVIVVAGGEAAVFGNSSGAVLALRAAAARVPITKLALWEPPFMVDPEAPVRQKEYVTELTQLLEANRRGDAMALFLKTIGLPDAMIAGMRQAPMCPGMEEIAPTLLYDAAVMGDSTVPIDLASVDNPSLVLYGSETGAWAQDAARVLTSVLPNSRSRALEGQNHAVAWEVITPVLREFFGD